MRSAGAADKMPIWQRLQSWGLQAKIAFSLSVLMTGLIGIFVAGVASIIDESLREDAYRTLATEVRIVKNLLERIDENLRTEATHRAETFAQRFPDPFSLQSEQRLDVSGTDTPALYSGRVLMNNNLGVIDRFTQDTGSIATIFARENDDFVRVATSLLKEDGTRAMGTYLGTAHPGYETLMQGRHYLGHAVLFGKPYMTEYTPIKDFAGNVIGILFIGHDLSERYASIKAGIRDIKIGDSGYIAAVSAAGNNRGHFLIHPTMEGKSGLETESVRHALQERNGTFQYEWESNGVVQDKIMSFAHIEGWDWILAATGSKRELLHIGDQLVRTLVFSSLFLGIVVLLCLFLIFKRMVMTPLRRAECVAVSIAEGDLDREIRIHGADEMSRMLSAMQRMQSVLKQVVTEIEQVAGAAAAGDFSGRIDVQGMKGYQAALAENINKLLQNTESGIRDVSVVLEAIAEGVLTQQVDKQYNGLFGKLKNSTNKTSAYLADIVDRIKQSAGTINIASRDVAAGNAELLRRSQEQAGALADTASRMEDLAGTVKQNAENARQANDLAAGASEVAARGGEVVSQVVQTMGGISEASKKIADIIGVIDSIAFQTNILALNAAVEAARAGEQGRGFAVVATEVRNLAQRSATAAKEIKGLITDSVGKVDSGQALVNQAGQTMQDIVTSVKRVTDIMSEITTASVEQSEGIEQVSVAVGQMDETTQQNTALVEEAAAAAESFEQEAASLAKVVARFRVKMREAGGERPNRTGKARHDGSVDEQQNEDLVRHVAGGRF